MSTRPQQHLLLSKIHTVRVASAVGRTVRRRETFPTSINKFVRSAHTSVACYTVTSSYYNDFHYHEDALVVSISFPFGEHAEIILLLLLRESKSTLVCLNNADLRDKGIQLSPRQTERCADDPKRQNHRRLVFTIPSGNHYVIRTQVCVARSRDGFFKYCFYGKERSKYRAVGEFHFAVE